MQITLKTLENDFLTNVHSTSVIDMKNHFSQCSYLSESQNLCDLREVLSRTKMIIQS